MRNLQKSDLTNGGIILTCVPDLPGTERLFSILYTIQEKPSQHERAVLTVYYKEMDMRSANFDFETTSKKMPVNEFMKAYPQGRQVDSFELSAIRQVFRKIREQKTT